MSLVDMTTASARLAVLACSLMLLAYANADSVFTLNWQEFPIGLDTGTHFYAGVNKFVTKDIFGMSMVLVDLPPCGARSMHIHMNTDEIHYVLEGAFLAGCALPNGTLVSDNLVPGQMFVAPRNYIHSMVNPSCTSHAKFMGIYGTFDANNNNIGGGALNMVGSPFAAYVDADRADSLRHAAATFNFDPRCMARCIALGQWNATAPQNGQLPAKTYRQ